MTATAVLRRQPLLAVLFVAMVLAPAACASGGGQRVTAGGGVAPGASGPGKSPTAETPPPVPLARDDSATSTVEQNPSDVTRAELVDDRLGWATTGTALFVTADGGTTWKALALPVPIGTVFDVALFTPARVLIAAGADGGVRVHATTDEGATWRESIVGDVLGGAGGAQFVYDQSGVKGLFVERITGANFSAADWFESNEAAGTWTRRAEAPVAGDMTRAPNGVLWLVGGPQRNRLFRSEDGGATWDPVVLPAEVTSAGMALSPVAFRGDLAILAVTLPQGSAASVVALTTQDRGRTWTQRGRVELETDVGAGVAVPTSPDGDGLFVASPGGADVSTIAFSDGRARSMPRAGLPNGTVVVQFATDRVGWAEFRESRCQKGKTDCSVTTGIAITRDAGQTWKETRPA